jgi:hypothetical protein
MATRGVRRASRRGRTVALVALSILVAGAIAGCGAKDFPNDPRPSAQIEVSASVNSQKVQISPDKFGAGIVNFTVANMSGSPVTFSVSGPKKGSTVQIQPGAPDYLKMNLTEGTYEATAGRSKIRPATIQVGAERKSSQNELLLP